MTRADIIHLQTRLTELGYRPGPVDGWYGEQTRRAYQTYLDDQNSSVPNLTPSPQKPWYLSRAVLGAIATIIASGAGIAGWAVDSSQLAELLSSLATLGFGILAFVGTIQRKGEIRGRYTKNAAVSADGDADDSAGAAAERMRVVVPAGHRSGPDWNERREDGPGWNG